MADQRCQRCNGHMPGLAFQHPEIRLHAAAFRRELALCDVCEAQLIALVRRFLGEPISPIDEDLIRNAERQRQEVNRAG